MEQISLTVLQGGFAVAVVVGVVEVIKRAAGLAKRYVPLASLVVGIAICGVIVGFNLTGVLTGIVVGLASSGLWSGVKATVGN